MRNEELKKQWSGDVKSKLVGRKIIGVRYMTDDEVKDCGWFNAAIILRLDDGTLLYPQSDDEGNNAGALATTDESIPVIPVI